MTSVPTNTGWSNTGNARLYDCIHGKVYSPYDQNSMTKTFNNLPPHYSLALNLEMWPFNSWDPDEHVTLIIDYQEIYKQEVNTGPVGQLKDMYIYSDNYCATAGLGSQFLLGHNLTHTDSSVTITLETQLNSPGADESFGVSRFMLYIDECHFTCKSCTGPNEDQCNECPLNSSKIGNSCICDVNYTSQDHQCVASCQNGQQLDTYKRVCVDQCPIQNCDTCSDFLCTSCSSGYKLMKGKCYDQCPWYAPESSGSCIDSTYNSVARPFTLIDDMINKDFSHSELESRGWSYIKTLDYNGKSVSSLSGSTCVGNTYSSGFLFMPTNVTCSTGCGITNSFNNLPPHYKVTINYKIQCGDTWDDEFYYTFIDNVQKQQVQFKQPYGKSGAIDCGRNRGDIDNTLNIFQHTITSDHTSSNINVKLQYNLNQMTWDEWGGYREISIYLHLCDNYRCGSCTSAGQTCGSCIGSTGQPSSRILGSNCHCPLKYYESGDDEECHPCLNECATCSDLNSCDTCIGSTGQSSSRLQAQKCICPDKFYDNSSDDECQACLNNCATCSDGSSCDTCKGQTGQLFTRILNQNCICPDKYYDDGSNDDCQSCITQCATCSDGTSCDTCIGSTGQTSSRIIGSNCQCPDKYYDNGVDDECQPCLDECATCSDGNSCDTCIGSTGQSSSRIQAQKCICPDKFYDNSSDDECQACLNNCATCSDSTSCDTCIGQTGQLFSRILNQNCICPDQYFDDGSNDDCQSCITQCATCSDGTSCDTCIGSTVQTSSRILESNCQCPDKYFDNGVDDECQPCLDECATCSDGNSCDTCIGSTGQSSSRDQSNNCLCPTQYHDNNNQLTECEICLPQCATCSDGDSCDTCIGSIGQSSSRVQETKCSCPDGFYDDHQNFDECQQCNLIKCNTCTENQDNCIICSDTTRSGFDCVCSLGYYEIQGQSTCGQCDEKCKSCENQPDQCLECADSSNRDLDNNCLCLHNYYDNGTLICQECDELCDGCTNTADNCNLCKGNNRKAPTCEAEQGYYIDVNQVDAQKCNKNCLTCNQANLCLTCNNGEEAPYCIQVTSKSFVTFLPDGEMVVQQCSSQCSSCQNQANNCLTCSDQTLSLQNGCLSLTQDSGCPKDCKRCDSSNICIDCDESSFYNTETNKCQKCYFYQSSCVSICPQFTVLDEQSLQCENNVGLDSTQLTLLILLIAIFIIGIVLMAYFANKKIKAMDLDKEKKPIKFNNLQGQSQINDVESFNNDIVS